MKKLKLVEIIVPIIILVILVFLAFSLYIYTHKTKTVVVVKASENALLCYGDSLYYIGISKEDASKYQEGQELLVFFDGWIVETYPCQLSGVSKIITLNQKSNIEIPEGILKYAYNSTVNVKITIQDLNTSGITFLIEDTNNLKYKYEDNYGLYRNNGSRWEMITKNHLNIVNKTNSNEINESTIQEIYDWSNSYGKLENGEYFFIQEGENFFIRIYFSVLENGEISNIATNIGL